MNAPTHHLRAGTWQPTDEHRARMQRDFLAATEGHDMAADWPRGVPHQDDIGEFRLDPINEALRDVQPGDPQPLARVWRIALPLIGAEVVFLFLLQVFSP